MEMIAPSGPVYQAGTLSGNPLAVAAGLASLKEISKPGFYENLETISAKVAAAILRAAEDAKCPMVLERVGSMFCPYFASGPMVKLDDVMASRRDRFKVFFAEILAAGVMPAPSPFESWFTSSAHDDAAIETTYRAALAGCRAAARIA
jgi:glutamate-1-semialdehyde 2,1-aminomutase